MFQTKNIMHKPTRAVCAGRGIRDIRIICVVRIICAVMIFAAVAGCLSSCSFSVGTYGRGSYPDARTLLRSLLEGLPESDSPAVIYSGKDDAVEGSVYGSPETFGRMYTGKWVAPACFSRIEDIAVRLPLDDSGFEIHVVVCVNRSDADEVGKLLSGRIGMIQNAEIKFYAPDGYEKYYESAEVYTRKGYVFLLATPDNDRVKKKIKDLT